MALAGPTVQNQSRSSSIRSGRAKESTGSLTHASATEPGRTSSASLQAEEISGLMRGETGLSETHDGGGRGSPQIAGNLREVDPAEDELPTSEDLCLPLSALDAVESQVWLMIDGARDIGFNVAADNLEHFLTGDGNTRELPVEWLLGFERVVQAVNFNEERFRSCNFLNVALGPERDPSLCGSTEGESDGLREGEERDVTDYWDRQILPADAYSELNFAVGTSSLRSECSATLSRDGDQVFIEGTCIHQWIDRYDWHPGLSVMVPGVGNVEDADIMRLQECRGAAPFDMRATWTRTINGRIELGGEAPEYFIDFDR